MGLFSCKTILGGTIKKFRKMKKNIVSFDTEFPEPAGWEQPKPRIPLRHRIMYYAYSTKLGHFLFLFIPVVILAPIGLLWSSDLAVGIVGGGFGASVFLATTDKNKKWI